MTLPTLTLDAVLGGGPLTDLTTATWTTLVKPTTADVLGPTRQRETDRFQPGRQTYKLPNSDRHFDPTAAAALLAPFTPLRLRATSGGTSYPVAVGYVDEETPDWVLLSDDFASIGCIDALSYLAGKMVNSSGYANVVLADGPSIYYRLNEPAGASTVVDSSGHNKTGTADGVTNFGQAALISLETDHAAGLLGSGRVTVPANNGIASQDFTIESWIVVAGGQPFTVWAQRPTGGAPGGINAGGVVFGDGTVHASFVLTGATFPQFTIWYSTPRIDDGLHHLAFKHATSGAISILVDGKSVGYQSGSTGTTPVLTATQPAAVGAYADDPLGTSVGVVDEVAIYDGTVLSDARIAAHYAMGSQPWQGDLSGARINRVLDLVGWPAAMRTIDSGRSVILAPAANAFASGGLNVADYLQAVAEAEGGRLFTGPDGFIVFHDRARPLRPPNRTSQATFSDIDPATGLLPAGALPYMTGGLKGSRSIAEVANEVAITRAADFSGDAPVPQVVEDLPSQNTLKAVKTFTQSGQLNPTDQECQNKALVILFNRKTPAFRIKSLVLDGRATDALWPVVLGLKVGDLITVMRHPPGGGAAYTAQLRIEGKSPKIAKRQILVTLVCSVADTTDYMTIGHALGGRLFW